VYVEIKQGAVEKMVSGRPFRKKGDFYVCEDRSGQSYWRFNVVKPGSVQVKDNEDYFQMFDGSLDEATI